MTTIRVSDRIKSRLDKIKIHPRETYEDVIVRLLDSQSLATQNVAGSDMRGAKRRA